MVGIILELTVGTILEPLPRSLFLVAIWDEMDEEFVGNPALSCVGFLYAAIS